MSSWRILLPAAARRRRAALAAAAAAMVPFVVLDHLYRPEGRLAVIGAAWVLLVLGGGLLQHEHRPWSCRAGVLLASVAGAAAIVLRSGGSESPLFGILVAMAPCIALAFPEEPGMALGAAVLSVGVGVLIRLHDGRSALDVIYWAALTCALACLALYGASLLRLQSERELAMERERRLAEEALARAEVARLELERLAEAGRLAARVAHELNSPLSAARSNLSWLLADPESSEDDRLEALRETVEAVQRIIAAVDHLQGVAWQGGKPAAPDR